MVGYKMDGFSNNRGTMLERLKSILLMKGINTLFYSLVMLCCLLGLNSCFNPFAPVEGDVGTRIWTDQRTIGGLLSNFELAYDYGDSLHYSDCIAESFVFHYYDVQNGRLDRWFRETDLKATGGMFRSFDPIDLEWNHIPVWIEDFSQPDTTVQFIVRFNLTLGQEVPLMGYAHFSVRMEENDQFRVVEWRDELEVP